MPYRTNAGRPVSRAGQLEAAVIDFRVAQRRALADGHLSHAEGIGLLRSVEPLLSIVADVAQDLGIITAILGSPDGVRGNRPQERIKSAWARPSNVVPFVRHEEGGDAA